MVYIEMNLFFDNDFDVYKIEKELNIKPSDCKRRNETRMSPFDKNEKLLYFSKKPESDRKFEERYNTIEYTPEVEAIFQIYHPQMPDPDWEFWKNELKDAKYGRE